MPRLILFGTIVCLIAASLAAQDVSKATVDQLVPWLLREDQELREIPFSQVVFAATANASSRSIRRAKRTNVSSSRSATC